MLHGIMNPNHKILRPKSQAQIYRITRIRELSLVSRYFSRSIPNFFIRQQSVFSLMSRILAASLRPLTRQLDCCKAAIMCWRSFSSNVARCALPVLLVSCFVSQSSSLSCLPWLAITARSMIFSSTRTLPAHWKACNVAITCCETDSIYLPDLAEYFLTKWLTKSGISSLRSR